MPSWVHFYQVAYFVPAVAIILLLVRIGTDLPTVRRIVLAFLVLLSVHYALYLLLPTSARVMRLDDAALGEGLLGELVRYQYRIATPWCAWPSLHVSACWFFYRPFARRFPLLRWPYLIWLLGMFVGTFAIKIHYIADGVTGFILAEAAYRFVYLRFEREGAFRWEGVSSRTRILVLLAVIAVLLVSLPLVMRASGFEGPLYTIIPSR
jgi:hypothetical protein